VETTGQGFVNVSSYPDLEFNRSREPGFGDITGENSLKSQRNGDCMLLKLLKRKAAADTLT
jgi:hypothetical protein